MLFKQLALVASAAAFLVVPDAPSSQDEEIFNALPIDDGFTFSLPPHVMAQDLAVPCKQCKGRDTSLDMHFEVEDASRLTLNGFELYPSADPWHGDLVAAVVKGNGKQKKQRLGYSLGVRPEAIDEEQQMELIAVELRVIEVGSRFVEGIPTVQVKLVRAPNGEIIIGSVDMRDAPQTECETMWCRAKALVDETWRSIKSLKGCGRHGSSDKIQLDGQRPHGTSSADGTHHNWGKLLKNIAANVVLPILMGVAAGVGVAVFAMALCSFVAIFIRARRCKSRRCRRSKADITEPAIEEEKTGLMDGQDALPQYRDDETDDRA